MAHDVFISHSSKDKKAADAICHSLERAGVKCWIAPRDVSPGAEYAEQLLNGIKNCSVFLLIFSEKSNASGAVAKEIESAVRYGKTIIPYRLDKSEMRASLEYYLSNLHWLDAYPDEKEFETLVRAVQNALGNVVADADVKTVIQKPSGGVMLSRRALILSGAALVFVAALFVVILLNSGDSGGDYYDAEVPSARELPVETPFFVEETPLPQEIPPVVEVPLPQETPPVEELPPPQETPPPVEEVPPPQETPPPVEEVPPPQEIPPLQETPTPIETPTPTETPQPETPAPPTGLITLESQGITGERLAEMVASGEIPANVTRLSLSHNPIGDISPLSELTELTWLRLRNVEISDISALAGLTSLTGLSLEYNQISDISALAALVNLSELSIAYNLVENIEPLANLTNLQSLSIVNNRISDVEPLHGLTRLTWLGMGWNRVSLEQITALREVLEDALILHFPQY